MRLLLLVLSLLICCATEGRAQAVRPSATLVAWSPAEPYLSPEGLSLDQALLQAAAQRAGLRFSLMEFDSLRAERALREGQVDAIAGIYAMTGLAEQGRLSAPYRQEELVLFLRSDAVAALGEVSTPEELVAALVARGYWIGLVQGRDQGPALRQGLAQPGAPGARLAAWAESDADHLRGLKTGRVDGFVADRLAGMHLLARTPDAPPVTMLPIVLHRPGVHLLLARDALSLPVAEALDEAIRSLAADGTAERIRARMAGPLLLDIAVTGRWLNLLDVIGTIAFAISGVLLARRERYSLFGALVLAALPAVGGGVVRDLLVGRDPIFIMQTPAPLLMVVGTVLTGFLLFRAYDLMRGRVTLLVDIAWLFLWTRRIVPPRRIYEVSDALGLASFTVTGVGVAVRFGAEPLWLWGPLLAVLTGAGGGILRDVVRADSGNPALRSSFYAEICLVWGLALSLSVPMAAKDLNAELMWTAVLTTLAGAFVMRMAVVTWTLRAPRF